MCGPLDSWMVPSHVFGKICCIYHNVLLSCFSGYLNQPFIFSVQLKEFANFDFDVWRKRYMRWMNHKKSRVMDFFRRIDKDQDGKVTRQEFIEGILSSSKF